MDEVTLPTGEKLPGYDDEPQVDALALLEWLNANAPERWSACVCGGEHCGADTRALVTDVIGALLAVGQATIVKNGTYRALERDRRAVEALAAGLSQLGLDGAVLFADGDPVKAALSVIRGFQETAEMWRRRAAPPVGPTTTVELPAADLGEF